jgi:peptidoglycan/LPS O-acetylase OafA/YrhL
MGQDGAPPLARWWERWPVATLDAQAGAPAGDRVRLDNPADPGNSPSNESLSNGPPTAMAVTGRYLPALDGIRALAIGGVLAYHLGYGWAGGGYLGVDLFFVLSGFLITSLLVEEWVSRGRIVLRAFWARRARRLLPALLAMLLLLMAWAALSDRTGLGGGPFLDLSTLRGDALATLFYVANWHEIFAHQPYFAQFSLPSPLEHTWSLAIEEQFYLVWPLVLILALSSKRRPRHAAGYGGVGAAWRRSGPTDGSGAHLEVTSPGGRLLLGSWRHRGLLVTGLGALASAAWMAYLYQAGAGVNRVYLGTDTRAFELLVGAFLAMIVAARPEPSTRRARLLHWAVLPALGWLAFAWYSASGPPGWLFEGGLFACALAGAVLVADARLSNQGPVGRVLSLRPLRFVGRISYGLYLWHWPVFVLLSEERTGLSGISLSAARLTVTFAVATLSFYLLERPLRGIKLPDWRRLVLAPAGVVATGVVILAATAIPASGAITSAAGPVPGAPSHAQLAASLPGSAPSPGASVPGAGGLSGEVPIRLPAGYVPTKAHPMSVMLIGDSVMYAAAPAIIAALDATGVVKVHNRAIPGWGLTTAGNWRTEIPALIRELKPEVVIGMWSWDNTMALERPRAYRKLLGQAVSLILAKGDGVDGMIFAEFPPLGPLWSLVNDAAATDARREAGVVAWNRIAASFSRTEPGRVMYFPVAGAVELHGKFTAWLPPVSDPKAPTSEWVRVRMVDNTHFCPPGAARYADAILADMTEVFHLPQASPSWWDGSWASARRYDNPPGSCPDDHPPS